MLRDLVADVHIKSSTEVEVTYKQDTELGRLSGVSKSYAIDADFKDMIIRALNQHINTVILEPRLKAKQEAAANSAPPVYTHPFHEKLCGCDAIDNALPCANKSFYINRLLYVVDDLRRRVCNIEVISENKLRFK